MTSFSQHGQNKEHGFSRTGRHEHTNRIGGYTSVYKALIARRSIISLYHRVIYIINLL